MADYYIILCSLAITVVAFCYYYISNYDFWKNRGIRGPKPTIFFGNFKDVTMQKRAISTFVKKLYDEYKHAQAIGIFQGSTPILVVKDLDLIKDVLIRDFSLFVNRGIPTFPKVEPLSEHLFLLKSEKWRPLRAKLSPVFTSGKLKDMFPLVVECANHLEEYLDKLAKNKEPVECRDLSGKFTTDVIGSCAFGIEMGAFKNEDNEFRKMGKQIFLPSIRTSLRNACKQITPFLYNIFGGVLQPPGINEFFTNAIVDTIKYRMKHNVVRPDFVNMLMELKQHPHKIENIELTDSLLTAQAFVFFIAGFETSSTTISFALYELAQNQEIQDKLRAEIRETCQEGVTYEKVKQMKYLDAVFRETLRKYPVLSALTRQASEDYTFKGTKITIPKDTIVWIPVHGIHHDPQIYPDPEIFNPERFTDDAVASRHPMSYLPFGDGPRNCIGARFAHYQSKVGLITILRNHKVDVCEKTTIPFKAMKESFLLALEGGVYLSITKAE
ncbi:cytochrome P450 6A1-like [Hylaeus volcanicus]|uniref:cytochrome P450 6A1-like n=1 Tax=Hylaeus volcanicus TaxID=313075 RepID=UPI0023B7FB05|nr:cytochrome P450 6A1-like [Hylaeus volcanicus]XP_053982865.1 cytochrome P450 6A1-like [Hylaeus volcanicus]